MQMKKMVERSCFRHAGVKCYFTLIELLVVIAIIAMFPRSKSSFFLPFSAVRVFLNLCKKCVTFKNEILP